jgi:drug/metabolite transporter (DMT)-like permease
MFLIFMALFQGHLNLKEAFTISNGWKFASLALLAGLVNGIGQLAFQNLIYTGRMELSQFAPAVLTIQAVIYTGGGALIYHEPFTAKKLIGLVAAAIAFRLLIGK